MEAGARIYKDQLLNRGCSLLLYIVMEASVRALIQSLYEDCYVTNRCRCENEVSPEETYARMMGDASE